MFPLPKKLNPRENYSKFGKTWKMNQKFTKIKATRRRKTLQSLKHTSKIVTLAWLPIQEKREVKNPYTNGLYVETQSCGSPIKIYFLMLFSWGECHRFEIREYVRTDFSSKWYQESVNLFKLSMGFLLPKHQNHWFRTELFFRLCKLDAACGGRGFKVKFLWMQLKGKFSKWSHRQYRIMLALNSFWFSREKLSLCNKCGCSPE